MSLDAFHPIVLNTVIARLAMLFMDAARGDPDAACDAAREMLESHNPRTPKELAIASHFIALSFHALDLLSQAADREQPPDRALRVLGRAVGVHREALKSERALATLQRQSVKPDTEEQQSAAAVDHPESPPTAVQEPAAPPAQPGATGNNGTSYRRAAQVAHQRPLGRIAIDDPFGTAEYHTAAPLPVPA